MIHFIVKVEVAGVCEQTYLASVIYFPWNQFVFNKQFDNNQSTLVSTFYLKCSSGFWIESYLAEQ